MFGFYRNGSYSRTLLVGVCAVDNRSDVFSISDVIMDTFSDSDSTKFS